MTAQLKIPQSNEAYHSDTSAISASGLKLLARSPRHYWAKYLSGRNEQKDTAALKFGTAFHCALLEPDRFSAEYDVMPEINRRTDDGKATYKTLMESGLNFITEPQMILIDEMRNSVMSHPVSKLVFGKGICESSLYALDPVFDVTAKVRPDYMIEPCDDFPNGLILDVKTAESAEENAFTKASFNYEYHIPAVMYPDVFQRVYKTKQPPSFLFLVIEKEFPFLCAYYTPSPSMISYGRTEYMRLMKVYADCKKSGNWYGYPQEITPLHLPDWVERTVLG